MKLMYEDKYRQVSWVLARERVFARLRAGGELHSLALSAPSSMRDTLYADKNCYMTTDEIIGAYQKGPGLDGSVCRTHPIEKDMLTLSLREKEKSVVLSFKFKEAGRFIALRIAEIQRVSEPKQVVESWKKEAIKVSSELVRSARFDHAKWQILRDLISDKHLSLLDGSDLIFSLEDPDRVPASKRVMTMDPSGASKPTVTVHAARQDNGSAGSTSPAWDFDTIDPDADCDLERAMGLLPEGNGATKKVVILSAALASPVREAPVAAPAHAAKRQRLGDGDDQLPAMASAGGGLVSPISLGDCADGLASPVCAFDDMDADEDAELWRALERLPEADGATKKVVLPPTALANPLREAPVAAPVHAAKRQRLGDGGDQLPAMASAGGEVVLPISLNGTPFMSCLTGAPASGSGAGLGGESKRGYGPES